jgi:HSP20 family protein
MPGLLAPWAPLSELEAIRSRLDRAYAEWSGDGEDRPWMPAVDVQRGKDALTVRADLPGVDADDIKIEARDNMLTIVGEKNQQKEEKDGDFLRRERRYRSFSRSMELPPGIDASKIKASAKDGVVEITIPLPSESKKTPVTITPTAG